MRPSEYSGRTYGMGDLKVVERAMPEFIPTRRASPVDRIRLTQALVDAKKKWYEAQARGDQSAMNAAHARANILRSQGADEQTALSMVPRPAPAPSAPAGTVPPAVPSQYGGAMGVLRELASRAAGNPPSEPRPVTTPAAQGIGNLRRMEAGQSAVQPDTTRAAQVATGYPTTAVQTPATGSTSPSTVQTPLSDGGKAAMTDTGATNMVEKWMPPQTPIPAVTGTQSLTSGPTGLDAIRAENAKLISAIEKAGNTEIQGLQSLYQTSLADIAKLRQDLIGRSEKDQKELDPATLATLDMLKGEMENGLRRVKEEANRRGILDSGIALQMSQNVDKAYGQQRAGILGERLTRLKQNLEDSLRRIDEQAFQVKQKGAESVNAARSRLAGNLVAANEKALARVENERRYQQARADEQANQQFNQSVSEANLTGRYLPSKVRNLVNRVLELKRQAEAPGVSQEALTGYSKEADTLRSQLPAYGIDPNLVGKGISYEEAAKNVSQMGTPTLAARKAEADKARQALTAVKPGRGAPVSGGGTPTQREKVSGIMQGAVDLVGDLMTQGKYLGEQGDSGRRYIRLTPSQAAEEAVNTVLSQVGDMGLSSAELSAVIDLIYRRAGVPKPTYQAPRPLTPKQQWENQYYGNMLAK